MKRKAILIESSNVAGEKDLPGARVDIDNWQTFLKSDLGGRWNESEILVLRKPYSSDVTSALTENKDAYCFVAFSGHGCNGSVVLNDHNKICPIIILKPKSEKGTLILDSCRGAHDAERAIFNRSYISSNASLDESVNETVFANAIQGKMAVLSSRGEIKKMASVSDHVVNWAAALKASPSGIVEMLSCSKGQAAGENPRSGGHYTTLLMYSAKQWEARYTGDKIHTTKSAHDFAVTILPSQQTPEYSPSWLEFPFAVKV